MELIEERLEDEKRNREFLDIEDDEKEKQLREMHTITRVKRRSIRRARKRLERRATI